METAIASFAGIVVGFVFGLLVSRRFHVHLIVKPKPPSELG